MRNRDQRRIVRRVESRAAGAAGSLMVAALLFLRLSDAHACLAPTRPEALPEHRTIVLAEVVGVRLTDYATQRWREISDPSAKFYTDASPAYEVDVLPLEVLKGSAPGKLTLSIMSGCAIPEANLRQVGLFYIGANGLAIPIYQDDSEYSARLSKLGSRYGAPCASETEQYGPHPCPKARQEFTMCLALLKDVAEHVAPSCPGVGRQIVERLEAELSPR